MRRVRHCFTEKVEVRLSLARDIDTHLDVSSSSPSKMSAPLTTKWRKVEAVIGSFPRPRHGHRAVAIRDMMLIFGGGNEGIVEEMHVYRSSKFVRALRTILTLSSPWYRLFIFHRDSDSRTTLPSDTRKC